MRMIIFLLIVFSFACDSIESKNEDLENLEIESFSLSKTWINGVLKIEIIDLEPYFNDVLLEQKVELSLQKELPEITDVNSIETLLNMPNRTEPIVNTKVGNPAFYKNIIEKSKNKKYRAFLQSFIKRLNDQNDFFELDAFSTALQIAINGDETEKDWFGINVLTIAFKRFNDLEGSKDDCEILFKKIEKVLKTANKSNATKNEDMFQFFKKELLEI